MDAFTCTGPIFRHTIAAHSFGEALQVALQELGGGRVVLWSSPDTWTCRAVEAAPLPGVVDAVPRFVVERGSGYSDTLELDHDNLPGSLRPGEAETLRRDSETHAAWLDAFEAVHAGGEALRKHVARVGTERDAATFARLTRALAGAYGLGPVPAWHAALLPALVALDVAVEIRTRQHMRDDWFELDRAVLQAECRGLLRHTNGALEVGAALIHVVAALQLSHASQVELRSLALLGIASLGWAQPMSAHAAASVFVSA